MKTIILGILYPTLITLTTLAAIGTNTTITITKHNITLRPTTWKKATYDGPPAIKDQPKEGPPKTTNQELREQIETLKQQIQDLQKQLAKTPKEAPTPNTATIKIKTTPDSTIHIDDKEIPGTGPERTITTPSLDPKINYYYNITAKHKNGKTTTKRIDFKTNNTYDLDLRPNTEQE